MSHGVSVGESKPWNGREEIEQIFFFLVVKKIVMEKKGIGTGAKNKKEKKKMKEEVQKMATTMGMVCRVCSKNSKMVFFRNRIFWFVCAGIDCQVERGIPFCEKKKIASSTGSVEGQKCL